MTRPAPPPGPPVTRYPSTTEELQDFMRTSEIRTRWLDYFAANGHEIRPSVSLVSPEPSILFTVAGMVPFIPYILGTEQPP